jgi:hypothetical protein
MKVRDSTKGKVASTKFTRISSNGTHSIVLCEPVTGRTHQVKKLLADFIDTSSPDLSCLFEYAFYFNSILIFFRSVDLFSMLM